MFLHRVAQQPKGVFGSGYVTRAPYEIPDPSTKRGYRLCIDFVYDWLVDAHQAPVIARDQLRVHPFSVQTWDAQSSGTIIKPIAEGALEKRWAELRAAWMEDPATVSPPGGENGSAIAARASAFLRDLVAWGTAVEATDPPGRPTELRVLVVGHSTLNRLLLVESYGEFHRRGAGPHDLRREAMWVRHYFQPDLRFD